MADSTSLSILRQTPLSSSIATQQWTKENFLPLSAQARQAWYGECDTAQATKAKTVEIPGITELQTGLQLRIKFTEAQRASSPTLNVNNLGAHPIRRSGTTAVVNYEWLAGEVIDLVFDGTNWIVSDGGIATTSYYGYTKLYNGATSTSTSLALAPAALNSYSENTVVGAPALLTTSTYSVGDRVRYQFNTYECISDVQTPGAWASISSHFKELDPLQVQIDNLSDAIADIDIPEVPTDLSAFTNSPGYLTAHQSLSDLYTLSGEVVEGLSNIVIPKLDTISGLVEDEVEKVDEISAKFDNYSLTGHTHTSSDITNFPPIPTVNNGTLTIQKNGTDVQTFTANQTDSVTANISVPTDLSDLTNNAGYAKKLDLSSLHSLSNYIPLSGNAKIASAFVLSSNGTNGYKQTINLWGGDGDGDGDTAIGYNAIVENSHGMAAGGGVAVGSNAKAKSVSAGSSIAIGSNAIASNIDSIQLGWGTNNTANTLQIWDKPLLERTGGKIFFDRIPTGTTSSTVAVGNHTHSEYALTSSIPTKTSDLTNDSGFVVSSDLTKVMEYQGSVTNFSDLPNNAKKGAVYDVISAYNDNPPGTNYAWSGTSWDPLGGSIDVSKFATKTQLEDYLPLSGGSMAGALSANNGFRADGYSGTTGLSIGNGENDEYYTHLIATTIKTQQSGGAAFLNNGYGYGLSVDAGWNSDLYGTYLNATKVKSGELFVNADMYGGGLSVGQGTDDIYGTYINATNLTAPGMIAGINNTTPHGGLSVTGIDFGDGSYLSSANDFALVSALNKLSSEVVNGLSVVVNPKLSVIADKVEEEVAKLDELSGKLSGYALTSDIPLSVSQLINDKGYITSSYVSLSAVEQNYVFVLTEEQKTALVQQSGMPAEAWGDFIVHINPNNNYGYIGNIDCYSVSQNANGDYVYTAGMPVIESALGWVPNNTIVQGSTVHNVLSVGNTSVDLALKSDLEKYLPLDGGGVITGALEIESINGHNMFAVRPYGTIKIGEGSNTDGTGAIAIGYNTSVDNWNSLAIGYGAYADKYGSIAIGHEAQVSAQYSIQLGYPASHGGARSILTTDNTFRVWEYPMLDGNTGNIPYARLSAALDPVLGNILSALQEINGTVGN